MVVDLRTSTHQPARPDQPPAPGPQSPAAISFPEPAGIDSLFVYGSLNDEHHFRLITGTNLNSVPASLPDYRRVHPKNAFAFAIPWQGNHIDGRLLSGVTPAILAKLDTYESAGSLYHRRLLQINAQGRQLPAWVYIADPVSLRPWIERGFGERDRIEEFVERSVYGYLEAKADRCLLTDRKQLAMEVTAELLSEEISGLMTTYFLDEGIAPWILKHEIEKANLPDLEWLESDRKAQRYAAAYLPLAVRFMVFNQVESKFRRDFRALSRDSGALYEHTLSSLMALKLLVEQRQPLRSAMTQLRVDGYQPDFTYPDYGVAALFIADELYQPERAQAIAEWLAENRQEGDTPLGAELEFSPLGVRAVSAREHEDPLFDSFNYFYDFDLGRRGWKLGAHVDDHGFTAARQERSRGFLELAFGRYRLLGDVSKPATRDPWVLAQLIDLAARFVDIRPHSLHLSIQADESRPFQRLETPEYFLCLLLLGGDLREDDNGRLREMRIFQQEILHPEMGLFLSRLNRHAQKPGEKSRTAVVEYQFSRLHYDYDYQPLILALKGFQRHTNPFPFKDCPDCPNLEQQQDIETALKQWAAFPTPVSPRTCGNFLEIVRAGLEEEAAIAGPGYGEYIRHHIGTIAARLERRNQRIIDYIQRQRTPEPQRPFE